MTDKIEELKKILTDIDFEGVTLGVAVAKKHPECAQKIIDYVHENHIDCHNCWDDMDRYDDHENLIYYILELDGDKFDRKTGERLN
jgi:hypothetical protein